MVHEKYDTLLGLTSRWSLFAVDTENLIEYSSSLLPSVSTNSASPSSTVDFDGCRLGGGGLPSPSPLGCALCIGVWVALSVPSRFISEIASSSTPTPLESFFRVDGPLAFGSISRPTSMGLGEIISMSSRSSSSRSSTSQSRRGSPRALPLLRRLFRWLSEDLEVLLDDVSHDGRVVYEDAEARGSDKKELRSGAPKFPTRSSLVTVGIWTLIVEMVSRLLPPFLKNTCRRLRKNRVMRIDRSLWDRVGGYLGMIAEQMGRLTDV